MKFDTLPFLVVYGDRVWQGALLVLLLVSAAMLYRKRLKTELQGAAPKVWLRAFGKRLVLVTMGLALIALVTGGLLKWISFRATYHDEDVAMGPDASPPLLVQLAAALPFHRADALSEIRRRILRADSMTFDSLRRSIQLSLVRDQCQEAVEQSMAGLHWAMSLQLLNHCGHAPWASQLRYQVLLQQGEFAAASALAESARVLSSKDLEERHDTDGEFVLPWFQVGMTHMLAGKLGAAATIFDHESTSLEAWSKLDTLSVNAVTKLMDLSQDLRCVATATALRSGQSNRSVNAHSSRELCQVLAMELSKQEVSNPRLEDDYEDREIRRWLGLERGAEDSVGPILLSSHWGLLIDLVGSLVALERYPSYAFSQYELLIRARASTKQGSASRALLTATLAFREAWLGRSEAAMNLAAASLKESRSLLPAELQAVLDKLEQQAALSQEELAQLQDYEHEALVRGLVFGHLLLAIEEARRGNGGEAKAHLAIVDGLDPTLYEYSKLHGFSREFLLRDFKPSAARSFFRDGVIARVLSQDPAHHYTAEDLRHGGHGQWLVRPTSFELPDAILGGLASARGLAQASGDMQWLGELDEAIDKWTKALDRPDTAVLYAELRSLELAPMPGLWVQ